MCVKCVSGGEALKHFLLERERERESLKTSFVTYTDTAASNTNHDIA